MDTGTTGPAKTLLTALTETQGSLSSAKKGNLLARDMGKKGVGVRCGWIQVLRPGDQVISSPRFCIGLLSPANRLPPEGREVAASPPQWKMSQHFSFSISVWTSGWNPNEPCLDSGPSLNLALLWPGSCGSDPAKDTASLGQGIGSVTTKTGRQNNPQAGKQLPLCTQQPRHQTHHTALQPPARPSATGHGPRGSGHCS